MNIAYVMSADRGGTDRLLETVAGRLAADGLRLAGLVQTNSECAGPGKCDMDVRLLPDGPLIRISQSLGAGSRGCRLDPGALAMAVRGIEDALDSGPVDLLLLNKFGKHEAEGKGLREVMAAALERGIPVCSGVNGANLAAFETFTGGLAQRLPADVDAIMDWAQACVKRATEPAA